MKKISDCIIIGFGASGILLIGGSIVGAFLYNHGHIYRVVVEIKNGVIKFTPIAYNAVKRDIIELVSCYTADINSVFKGIFLLGVVFFVVALIALFTTTEGEGI